MCDLIEQDRFNLVQTEARELLSFVHVFPLDDLQRFTIFREITKLPCESHSMRRLARAASTH